jgi:hypothetical protein
MPGRVQPHLHVVWSATPAVTTAAARTCTPDTSWRSTAQIIARSAPDDAGEVILLRPDADVAPGTRVF